jgi:hypothetical protein
MYSRVTNYWAGMPTEDALDGGEPNVPVIRHSNGSHSDAWRAIWARVAKDDARKVVVA